MAFVTFILYVITMTKTTYQGTADSAVCKAETLFRPFRAIISALYPTLLNPTHTNTRVWNEALCVECVKSEAAHG